MALAVVAATAVAAAPVPGEAALAASLACEAGTGWSKTPATEHLAAPVFLAAKSLACASLSSSCPIAASSSAVPLAPVAFPESAYLLLAFQKTYDLSSLLPCPFSAALVVSGAVSSAAVATAAALDVAVVECFCLLRCWLDQLAYSSSVPSLSSMR